MKVLFFHPRLSIVEPLLQRFSLKGTLRPCHLHCKAPQSMVGRKATFSLETQQHNYFHLSPVAATLCGLLRFLSAIGSRTPEAVCAESSAYAHMEFLCQLWLGLTEEQSWVGWKENSSLWKKRTQKYLQEVPFQLHISMERNTFLLASKSLLNEKTHLASESGDPGFSPTSPTFSMTLGMSFHFCGAQFP